LEAFIFKAEEQAKQKNRWQACKNCLHLASFLLCLLSDHKDGGSAFLWNNGGFLLDYMYGKWKLFDVKILKWNICCFLFTQVCFVLHIPWNSPEKEHSSPTNGIKKVF
jgi:hypothetical protein